MPHTEEIREVKERLSRLEETCYFQETALAALNEALTDQQRQMDLLETQLRDALEKVRVLHALLDAQGGEAAPPPHSVPGLY